jgi:hypothetical protein
LPLNNSCAINSQSFGDKWRQRFTRDQIQFDLIAWFNHVLFVNAAFGQLFCAIG